MRSSRPARLATVLLLILTALLVAPPPMGPSGGIPPAPHRVPPAAVGLSSAVLPAIPAPSSGGRRPIGAVPLPSGSASSRAGTLENGSPPWTDLTANLSAIPSPRQALSMAYDPLLGAVVLFGGQTASTAALGDTWEFANGTWTNLTASLTTAPAARWGAGLTYDPTAGALVLFGGRSSSATWYNDTWEFNASGWTQVSTSVAPPPWQARQDLVYDSSDGYVLLHGTAQGSGLVETWSFANGTWSNLTAAQSATTPNLGFYAVDDPADGYVVFFGGGVPSCTGFGLTWTYHNDTWTNLTTTAGSPTAVMGSAASTFDAALGAVVLFGGYTASCAVVNQTWAFHNGTWSALATDGPTPPGTWDGRLAYDSALGGDLLFGGNGALLGGSNSFVNDTWWFNSTRFPPVASMSAAPASGPVPLPVQFTSGPAFALDALPLEYNWSFGDGTPNATTAGANHTYTAPGAYNASLTVSDQAGRRATFQVAIVGGPPALGAWNDVSATVGTTPTPRQSYAMVYDPPLGAAVLFGGQDSSGNALGDTWEFQNGRWVSLSPATSPAARWAAGAAYDPAEGGVILFGGRNTAGTYFNDTWLFNASGWTNLTPAGGAPEARAPHGRVAYDYADNYLVLFGGGTRTTTYYDTWVFARGAWFNWTTVANGTPPSAAWQSTYDAADGYVLAYGGTGDCSGPAATWSYRRGNWSDLSSRAGTPTAAAGAGGLTYDPIEHGVLLTGGYDGICEVTNQTWLFYHGAWYDLTNLSLANPPGRWDAQMVFDPTLGGDLLWGGNEEASGGANYFTNDTWEFADGLAVHAAISPVVGEVPLVVNVSVGNLSGGSGGYSYNWSWGDGAPNATTSSASHSYATPGTYAISGTVNDSQGRFGTVIASVRAYPDLGLHPVVSTNFGEAPLPVTFAANATGGVPALTYLWEFGDGATSASADPMHDYARAGTYTWNLTVTDAQGTALNASGVVQVLPTLTAQVIASPLGGEAPLTVNLTGNVSGGLGPYAYAWQFGDGSPPGPNQTTVSHVYASAGTYVVSLNVTDALGVRLTATDSVVVVPPLAAGGIASPITGTAPLTVQFYANPTGGLGPYAVDWTFGDGTSSTSVDAAHLYAAPGSYAANLQVTDRYNDTVREGFAIDVAAPLSVGVTVTPVRAIAPATVTFLAARSGGIAPFQYAWGFGDGGTASAGPWENHTYAHPGTFTATLVLTDAEGTVARSSTTVELAAPVSVQLSANVTVGEVGAPVEFIAQAAGGFPAYTFAWPDLPPGCPSQNRSTLGCTPLAAGNYPVTVRVTDASGHSNTTTFLFLVNPVPVAVNPGTPSEVPLIYGVLGIVGAAVVVAGLLLWRRRRSGASEEPPSADEEPPEEYVEPEE